MTTPTPTPETFISAIGREALFQPWHGGPCPLCPQEIVTVKTQSGEEHTGLAKNFQWEWEPDCLVAEYPAAPSIERNSPENVTGFYPAGGCQKLTGNPKTLSIRIEKPADQKKMELSPGAWLFIGVVICLALRGAAKLFGVWP